MAVEAYTQTVPVGAHLVTIDRVDDDGATERYTLKIDDVVRGLIVRLPATGRRWRLRALPGDASDDLPGFWREDGQAALFIKLAKEAVAHFREGRMRSAAEMAAEQTPATNVPDAVRFLRDIVTAWESRPTDHLLHTTQTWLDHTLAPAIETARAAVAKPQKAAER